MIIDSHYHIFPALGGPSGFPSAADHLRFIQLYIHRHIQPVRRVSDDSIVAEVTTGTPILRGPDDLWDVNFRIEKNGRFVWTKEGEDVYLHYMPPSLRENASPPDLAAAQMAYAGVDVAVLQNATPYGRLDEYFADAAKKYPGKFVGLATVDVVNAHTDAALNALRRAANELGLRGIYYANRGFFFDSFRRSLDDERYEPYWELVRELKLPVFWEIAAVPTGSERDLLDVIDRLNRWADRYPEIQCVYTHGVGQSSYQGKSTNYLLKGMPDALEKLLKREQFTVEILFPIVVGRDMDYPYAEVRPIIAALRDRVGAERMCWGSDMPNVERYCTYRQSLDYLRKYCGFIPPREMDLILGDNVARLLGVAAS